jgi:hypothetical protein
LLYCLYKTDGTGARYRSNAQYIALYFNVLYA